jgi:hypothetical protein
VNVPRTLSYRGLKCAHNSDVTARTLLNGDLMFCASWNFKSLGVAKIAHSTTGARRPPRQILKRISQIRLEDGRRLDLTEPKSLSTQRSRGSLLLRCASSRKNGVRAVCRAFTAIVHIAMPSMMRRRNRLIACW